MAGPVACLDGPEDPSCRNAKESSPRGFVMLDGRGGGDRLPAESRRDAREDILLWLTVAVFDGLKPSDIPIALKA